MTLEVTLPASFSPLRRALWVSTMDQYENFDEADAEIQRLLGGVQRAPLNLENAFLVDPADYAYHLPEFSASESPYAPRSTRHFSGTEFLYFSYAPISFDPVLAFFPVKTFFCVEFPVSLTLEIARILRSPHCQWPQFRNYMHPYLLAIFWWWNYSKSSTFSNFHKKSRFELEISAQRIFSFPLVFLCCRRFIELYAFQYEPLRLFHHPRSLLGAWIAAIAQQRLAKALAQRKLSHFLDFFTFDPIFISGEFIFCWSDDMV